MRPEVHMDISREVELLAELLTNEHQVSKIRGYEGDHLYVRAYMEDSDPHDEHRYYHDMLVPAIKAFAGLLNNANFIEFDELPADKSGAVAQVVGGKEHGLCLRKTTSYNILGDQNNCPNHPLDDEHRPTCPEDCDHDWTPRFGPGTEVIYDVRIRSSPRLQIR